MIAHCSKTFTKTIFTAACGNCSKTFFPPTKSQRFCSPRCFHTAMRSRVKVPCRTCGKIAVRYRSEYKRHPKVFCSKSCAWKGPVNPRWRNGVGVTAGYREFRGKNNRQYEHRRVMENKLRRPLKNGEVVHHVNQNKLDNRPENLIVFKSQKDHRLFHANNRIKNLQ